MYKESHKLVVKSLNSARLLSLSCFSAAYEKNFNFEKNIFFDNKFDFSVEMPTHDTVGQKNMNWSLFESRQVLSDSTVEINVTGANLRNPMDYP